MAPSTLCERLQCRRTGTLTVAALQMSSYTPAPSWSFGLIRLREEPLECGPARVVLRATLSPGNVMKLIIPAGQGALTPLAISKGIRHICPIYKGPPGELEYHGSLFIFNK